MSGTRYVLVAASLAATLLFSNANAGDSQTWSAIAVKGPASDKSRFLLWFDGHARYRDGTSELATTIIRPGIGWRATKNLDLWIGYARVTGHRAGPDIEEDRVWQQASYPVSRLWGGQLAGRTRLEQRSRDAGDDTGWRLRQAFRWSMPIDETKFSYVVANETFFGLNDADWGQRSGYDQNRAFLGIAWQSTARLRVELGYLNNHIDGGAAGERTNHNVALAFSVGL